MPCIHTLAIHTSLDSCRPVDQGWPEELAGHPSSALLAVDLLRPSLSSILFQQGLAREGPAPDIFSIFRLGSLLFEHALLSNPCMVEAGDFLFRLS